MEFTTAALTRQQEPLTSGPLAQPVRWDMSALPGGPPQLARCVCAACQQRWQGVQRVAVVADAGGDWQRSHPVQLQLVPEPRAAPAAQQHSMVQNQQVLQQQQQLQQPAHLHQHMQQLQQQQQQLEQRAHIIHLQQSIQEEQQQQRIQQGVQLHRQIEQQHVSQQQQLQWVQEQRTHFMQQQQQPMRTQMAHTSSMAPAKHLRSSTGAEHAGHPPYSEYPHMLHMLPAPGPQRPFQSLQLPVPQPPQPIEQGSVDLLGCLLHLVQQPANRERVVQLAHHLQAAGQNHPNLLNMPLEAPSRQSAALGHSAAAESTQGSTPDSPITVRPLKQLLWLQQQ